jgi:hypothetical protein
LAEDAKYYPGIWDKLWRVNLDSASKGNPKAEEVEEYHGDNQEFNEIGQVIKSVQVRQNGEEESHCETDD